MWSATLESPYLLLSYSIIYLAFNHQLISTSYTHINIYLPIYLPIAGAGEEEVQTETEAEEGGNKGLGLDLHALTGSVLNFAKSQVQQAQQQASSYNLGDGDVAMGDMGGISSDYAYNTANAKTGTEDTDTSLEEARDLKVYHSESLIEKKSIFISHIAQIFSMEDLSLFKEEVMSDKKVARATHNILAYRFTDAKTGVVYHDTEDDGE